MPDRGRGLVVSGTWFGVEAFVWLRMSPDRPQQRPEEEGQGGPDNVGSRSSCGVMC